jgi:Tfp pilus assembly protein PilN
MRAVNLLPREEPRRAGPALTLQEQLLLAAPLLAAAIVLAGFLMASAKVHKEASTVQGLHEQLASLPAPKRPVVDQSLVTQHGQRVSALAEALSGRVAWDRILREISSVLPEDVWLTSLDVQSPDSTTTSTPTPTPTPTAGPTSTTSSSTPSTGATSTPLVTTSSSGFSPLTISGYTYSQEGVARFMARLAVIPELTHVTLQKSFLSPISGRSVVQFTIQADIRRPGAGS